MKIKLICILIAISFFTIGCESPPLEEAANAREVVFMAGSDKNVTDFASDTLAHAREALGRMEDALESKQYQAAKTHAAQAVAAAERAIAEGRLGAESNRRETVVADDTSPIALTSIEASAKVQEEIDETLRDINGARYSLMDLDYDSLDLRIARAYSLADQAEADILAGRYQAALDKIREIREELARINLLIANAATLRKK